MASYPHDSSFSFSRRFLQWKKMAEYDDQDHDDTHQILSFHSSSSSSHQQINTHPEELRDRCAAPGKKHAVVTVSKLRSALFGKTRSGCVVGTIFGHRRGHVHFSVQAERNSKPTFLIELAMPTSVLVREMASGVARIALECERNGEKKTKKKKKGKKLAEEAIWRAYCNGKKYGYANRFECGAEEWRVLKAVGPITVGAGVLPEEERRGNGGGRSETETETKTDKGEEEGEVMYMRAKFERVVGSRDSEAFYMMNPDGVGGPELSIFLLRV